MPEIAIHIEISRETTSDGSIHKIIYTQDFNLFKLIFIVLITLK